MVKFYPICYLECQVSDDESVLGNVYQGCNHNLGALEDVVVQLSDNLLCVLLRLESHNR